VEGLATPREVADYLKIKEQTLRLWASKGRGPVYVMIGGARRYRWSDIEAYIESRTVRHG
jgi:excisionase family DNA binding protein